MSLLAFVAFFPVEKLFAADLPRFLGAQSCAASSCHGGAGEKSDEYTIWSTRDFHHQRPYATLTTARSERLAEVLKLGDATKSPRCTVCHAPFATVPSERLAKEAKITEGVSCESCHGAAENWVRSHTRPDYTHADRVAAGMRDLKNLYVRANTCVACHQNLDPDIRAAGHPELIFELDGQSAAMPRHWREPAHSLPAHRWLIGQFVALRETAWQLAAQESGTEDQTNRWQGLALALRSAGKPGSRNLTAGDLAGVQRETDHLARHFAPGWDRSSTELLLKNLADSSGDFSNSHVPVAVRARYAERLVLGLDRIVLSLDGARTNAAVNQALNRLFADVQSLPDFDPEQFAKDLKAFKESVDALPSK